MLLAATGCAPALPVPPPRPVAATVAGGLEVTLIWSPAVDLDLYVTDPTQETVYFANPRAASGGGLERDEGCPDAGSEPAARMEVVRWTAPPPGIYRIGVDYGDRCGQRDREVAYRLIASGRDLDREVTGIVRLKTFVYQALEIERPAEQSLPR